jgi:predicted membrane-bound mannosyltransferase
MPARARLLVVALLVAGAALRLAFLDADPVYYAWVGYITDEGRWVAHAREMVLFGHLGQGEWLLHLILAPLFQAVAYVSFELFGVSMWAARLPTALAGGLLLVAFWLLLRRVVAPAALLVGVALLALDVDLIELSRVAVPETAAMLVELGAYALVASGRPTPRRLVSAGLVVALAVAVKATSLPLIGILSAIVLFQPATEDASPSRARGLALLWAGFLTPLLVPALLAVLAAPRLVGALAGNLGVLGHFLRPARPFAMVSFFVDAAFAPTFNIWAVGAILSTAVFLLARGAGEPAVRRHFVASAIWYGLYTPLMLSLDYFPDRYKAHALIPLAINLAAGLSLVPAATEPASRPRRSALAVLLALPIAGLVAPTLAGIAMEAGADPSRLRVRLACVALALVPTAWLVHRALGAPALPRFPWIFAPLGVLGWVACLRLGVDGGSFWPATTGARVAWWSLGVPATALAAGLVALAGRRWSAERGRALAAVAVLAYAALAVSRIVPAYVTPQYSIRQASREIGRSLAGVTVATSKAEGLFNDNRLPYRSVLNAAWPADGSQALVVGFAFLGDEARPPDGYRPVATYRLRVSPEYAPGPPEPIRVYRR